MSKVSINLHPDEADALRRLSMQERRSKARQAEIIIRRKLEEEGVLMSGKGAKGEDDD
jgi:hypothetical protein